MPRMRRPASALVFLALSGAGGAGLGSALRWYWDFRVRTAPLRSSAQALLVTYPSRTIAALAERVAAGIVAEEEA
jgi:hypothetical protein